MDATDQLSHLTRGLPTQHIHQYQIQQQQLHSLDTTGDSPTTFPTSYTTPTSYPSAADDEHSQTQSHPLSSTTTPSPSTSTGFWPLPGQEEARMNDPSPSAERATPPIGPSPSDVGGRSARRVQRCGVGPSRHGPCKATLMEIRCWDHGCEGRKFSSLGNYRRHLREKNGQAKVHPCPDCGRVFTRSTARNFHRESGTCGLSPRQLMLQMQVQVQNQTPNPPLAPFSLLYPSFNVPSPMIYDSYVDWDAGMDLYSAPGVVLWGGINGR
ncbi:uncharacterized protein BDV17DRAFT_292092 [Aspergillus undulatus]|uniref:uncharacterized protein n=1 Tax=Aspergillus undulatus TaxID=1810928 RepID=UPI003CCDC268